MKINKFKKLSKGKYKLFFDNTELILHEDIILKYDLLIKNDIDIDLLDKIIEDNKYYECYNQALDYIEIKMRNKKEIIKYLEKKEYTEKYIDFTIEKLEQLNILNDNRYIEAYINDKIHLSNDGPNKIKKDLMSFGFNEQNINDYLYKINDETWKEKVNKIINKKKSIMKSKSYYMFIQKLKNDLYNMGYTEDLIEDNLRNIEYNSNAITKDFEKLNKKYKSDKTKIINSMLRKGYNYEEIKQLFDNE